ncbi:energy-coupling factor transporter transmembrane component T [Actinomyces sp. ZJ308]|uniref:energy-coupling factor transporter transmembrane component T n=1 Tax=Actinomyces sp. ZJ308 TaxID=2708342 RepID=UPI00141F131B|nr:energy-coupling factor transporter transmembrane component T [Actinomyces sp. ZJ308]
MRRTQAQAAGSVTPAEPARQPRTLLGALFGGKTRPRAHAACRVHADPRSKIILLLVCNVLVMGVASSLLVGLIAVLVGVLIALDEPVRVLVSYALITAVFWGLTQLPQWWPTGLAVLLGVSAYWLLRFAISLSLGAWFVTTTRVSTLLPALNQLRAPRFLTIPLAVLFRFVPAALDEARGVIEAMRLRGYSGSYVWRHPLDGIEKLVVPVLAASARSADDLSAAALIRGLGSGGRPTVVDRLRFAPADAVLLVLSGGLVALALHPAWGR